MAPLQQHGTSAEALDGVDSGGRAGNEDEDDAGGGDGRLMLRHAGAVDQEVGGVIGDDVVSVGLLEELDGDAEPDAPRCVDRGFVGPGHEEVLESKFDVSFGLQGGDDVLSMSGNCLRCQGDLIDAGDDLVGIVIVPVRVQISWACGIWLGNQL